MDEPAAPVRLPHRVVIVGGGFAGLYAARSLGHRPRGARDARRPAQLPPVPAAALPGRDRRPVARRDRPAAALDPAQAAATPRSSSARPSASTSSGARSCCPTAGRSTTTRSSSRPGARHSLLRPPRVGAARAGAQDRSRTRPRSAAGSSSRSRRPSARPTPTGARAWMTFVLVGGGPTGVELAGALGEIAHDTLKRDFRRSIRPPDARIILIEAMDRILPPYPPDRSRVGAAPAREARGHGPDEHARHRHRRARGPRR